MTRETLMRIRYLTCEAEKEITDIVVERFTKEGVEYLKTQTGWILQLDHIVELTPVDSQQD